MIILKKFIIVVSFMGRYSWPIIRRLKALKPTDRVLFLFYFSRHKLETSYNDAQAKKIHGSRTSGH